MTQDDDDEEEEKGMTVMIDEMKAYTGGQAQETKAETVIFMIHPIHLPITAMNHRCFLLTTFIIIIKTIISSIKQS